MGNQTNGLFVRFIAALRGNGGDQVEGRVEKQLHDEVRRGESLDPLYNGQLPSGPFRKWVDPINDETVPKQFGWDKSMQGDNYVPPSDELTHSLSDETPSPTNPKTQYGLRKPPLHLIPSTALVLISEAHRLGAKKYGAYNWRETNVEAMTYLGAALRHIHSFLDGEEVDTDPAGGTHHLAHAAACLNILLDASACGTLVDDRPAPAPTGQMINDRTLPI